LTQLAYPAGPVRDPLSEVAKQLRDGSLKPADAARRFLGDVRKAIESGGVEGTDTGGAVAGAAGERGAELFQSGIKPELATEPGAEGKPQTLLPGVAPLTEKDRIAAFDAMRNEARARRAA